MENTENGKGQPRSFKNSEEFENCFNQYIEICIKKECLPNIAGFCVYAEINRDTFYAQKEYYSDTFKRVQDILEDATINAKINDTFKIFYLKNKFNYTDKTEIYQSIDANVSNYKELSTEELKKLAGE